MAAIVAERDASDGYDVDCVLANGTGVTFHFAVRPDEVQAAVDELEPAYLEIPVIPPPLGWVA